MKSHVEKLPGEPIIIVSIKPHSPDSDEMQEVADAVAALIEGDGPVYRINDFTEFGDFSFSGLQFGLDRHRGHLPGTLSDARIRPVFVGTQDMVKLGATAARQEQYGHITVQLFATLDEALRSIRAEIAA